MVLHSGDPHSWNNSLAHATFDDNVDRVGRDTALQLLREDIRSWIKERRGESHQWSLWVRDGQMVTQTGVSLQEMTHNITDGLHSDLVPESIKATAPLEAATLEEATRLAVAGADRIILPEQHLNQRGEVIARYLSVWTRDTSDPTVYRGSRIDLGKNVRIEDVRTGTSFAAFQDGQGVSFHEHREQKHAFVLAVQNNPTQSFERVEKSIVATIHRSHQETYGSDSRPNAYAIDGKTQKAQPEAQQTRYEVFDNRETVDVSDTQRPHDMDIFIQAPRTVVRETVETVRGVAVFLRDKGKREEVKDRIRRVFARGKNSVDNHNAVAVPLSMRQTSERLTIEKIREKPEKIVKAVETRHAEMRQNVAVLLVAAETKVAIAAAPLVLAALAKELPKPVEAVTKSMRRHEKRKLRMRNYELRRKAKRETEKVPVKVQPLKTERVEPSLRNAKEQKGRKKRRKVYMGVAAVTRSYTFEKHEKQGKRGETIGVKKIAVAEKMTPITLEKRERRKERRRLRRVIRRVERVLEAKRVPKKEKKVWVAVAVAATEFVCAPRREKRERAVIGISFAWALWMLLVRKEAETPKSTFIRHRLASQDDVLQNKEETLWVLLSIIWYLTAIREQAMRSHPVAQISPVQQTIPQYAVIYAFAS